MSSSNQGEAGVIAWCNTIRLDMATHPGREFLNFEIKEGLDYLDSYLETILKKPKGGLYDVMKTPSRKKGASKRAAATAAASSKLKAVVSDLLLEPKEKENVAPVNEFHQALLQAKSKDDEPKEDLSPTKPKRAESPHDAPPSDCMVEDEVPTEEPAPVSQSTQPPEVPPTKRSSRSPRQQDVQATSQSDTIQPSQSEAIVAAMVLQTPTIVVPEETAPSTNPEIAKELSMIVEENERSRMSVQQPLPEEEEEDFTDEDDGMELDTAIMIPIKDEDATTTTTLNRKPSISQFGLLGPSPLKKSTRGPREPSAPPMPSQTPGTGMHNKRGSWLVKAKASAFEMTDSGKKKAAAPIGLGITTAGESSTSRKRKSEDMEQDTPLVPGPSGTIATEEPERKTKAARTSREDDVKRTSSERVEAQPTREETTRNSHSRTSSEAPSRQDVEEFTVALKLESPANGGALDRFRKTMDGGRTARSMGKSLGGAAAAALAEARAAAEARVAQRNKEESGNVSMDTLTKTEKSVEKAETPAPALAPVVQEKPTEMERRLSVSDLIPVSAKPAASSQPVPVFALSKAAPTQSRPSNASMSTTPPNSPPPPSAPIVKPVEAKPVESKLVEPKPPVFSRPQVFSVPPKNLPPRPELPAGPSTNTLGATKPFSFKLPETNVFSRPIATTLGVPATLSPPHTSQPSVLSAQPSQASVFSDAIFDKEDNIPAWVPTTQDTDYSGEPSIPNSHQKQLEELENEDPIWPVADGFASNNMWTPYGFASTNDDTGSTYSTAEDGALPTTQSFRDALQRAAMEHTDTMPVQHLAETVQTQSETEEGDVAMNVDTDGVDSELEDILRTGQSTISLVPSQPQSTRSESQQSMASTSSSQSQLGFFGQASKFVSNYLGGKKKAEPVKSIQRAAAAAKKQQEEADKKAARLNNMEARRQQVAQRKAEEEKAKALEEERKLKEETERRKREREEHTDKRPLKTVKKAEDDTTKKRKIGAEVQKKPDTQKPPSREQPSRLGKPAGSTTPATKTGAMKSLMKQPSSSQLASTTPAAKDASRQLKPTASTTSLKSALKGKGKAPLVEEDLQPSQQLQSQMVYRAQAHMKAAEPRAPPKIAPESIELPEVHSDYEYSDEEVPKRNSFEPPEWAQSPELRQALEQQSTINPDEIFGPIAPLRMEELFRGAGMARVGRLKARSSSANWAQSGDAVTREEEEEYARRMGYQ